MLEDLAARVSPRVLAAPRTLDEPRRELDEYFAGRRNTFEMALDWQLTGGFGRRVLAGHGSNPVRLGVHLQGRRGAGRQPARITSRRERAGRKPAADRRPLPSGRVQRWRARRLHRRGWAQAGAARGGDWPGFAQREVRLDGGRERMAVASRWPSRAVAVAGLPSRADGRRDRVAVATGGRREPMAVASRLDRPGFAESGFRGFLFFHV